jgi:hypothetical protein
MGNAGRTLRFGLRRCLRVGAVPSSGRLLRHHPLAERGHARAVVSIGRVELDRIHLRDGPLVTSAVVTAGIDFALALVTENHAPPSRCRAPRGWWSSPSARAGSSRSSPSTAGSGAGADACHFPETAGHQPECLSRELQGRGQPIGRCTIRTLAERSDTERHGSNSNGGAPATLTENTGTLAETKGPDPLLRFDPGTIIHPTVATESGCAWENRVDRTAFKRRRRKAGHSE